jgi:hypothetical protein
MVAWENNGPLIIIITIGPLENNGPSQLTILHLNNVLIMFPIGAVNVRNEC